MIRFCRREHAKVLVCSNASQCCTNKALLYQLYMFSGSFSVEPVQYNSDLYSSYVVLTNCSCTTNSTVQYEYDRTLI